MADVRLFFAQRQVMEVDTPVLSQSAPTAPYLDSFQTHFYQGTTAQAYFMQTSPEFAMKRLLSAGSGSIYQIARVFRNGEVGRQHSPEFLMLEWYRVDFSLMELIEEVDLLMQYLLNTPPAVIESYTQLFRAHLAIDIHHCTTDTLRNYAKTEVAGVDDTWTLDRDGWLELLMSEVIEPKLKKYDRPVIVTDFPASQAQLAKVVLDSDGNRTASRFELYYKGVELANGYDELCDASELKQRFERDNEMRQQQGKPVMPIDYRLLTAMQLGLPQCSGVALGLDRLLMIAESAHAIDTIQSIHFLDS